MAEVLSFLTSPSNDPVSLGHPRSSPSPAYQSSISSTQQQPRGNQMSRNQYNSQGASGSGYRGTSAAPIAPYAFKATPQLRNDGQRSTSSPSSYGPQPLSSDNSPGNRQRYPAQSSISTSSSSSSNPPVLPPLTKDDSITFSNFSIPSFSTDLGSTGATQSSTTNNGESTAADYSTKSLPERYRRGQQRRTGSNSSVQGSQTQTDSPVTVAPGPPTFGTGKMGQFFYEPQNSLRGPARPSPAIKSPTVVTQQSEAVTATESPINPSFVNSVEKTDLPKRYRGRTSLGHTLETGFRTPTPPGSRTGVHSPREVPSPDGSFGAPDSRPASSGSAHGRTTSFSRNEPVSPRSPVSADAVRRINNPSPLSKPYPVGEPLASESSPSQPHTYATNPAVTHSPAVAAMAALNANDKSANKGVKSRIRRAFSFGSAHEMNRIASGEADAAADRAKARQEEFRSELDEEQDAIARKQEAQGFGHSIYSGQGNVFGGSTDNLSISSTASSASLMLRKMGKGMKKGGRSIKGLFRPKSVVGVPPADGPTEPSVGPVAMVTVEAEREQVNVNANAADQVRGGTGFPKLERNSIDTGRVGPPGHLENGENGDGTRRSILGGEQERSEVLAAVKRGILKRSGTSSPVASPLNHPADGASDHPSPNALFPNQERRGSPVPSTTSSEPRRTGHRRTDSHTLEGDDYFAGVPRLHTNLSSRSLPGTPGGTKRNISFSPRIQFHDVWSSSEYDRRGDIATCNRLTPMLAQQIKEELNTFKMEMEVHEESKPHTHFF